MAKIFSQLRDERTGQIMKKLCICTAYGQSVWRFRLSPGQLYGHDENGDFICVRLDVYYNAFKADWQAQKSRTVKIFVLRRVPNEFDPRVLEWKRVPIEPNSWLYTQLLKYLGGIPRSEAGEILRPRHHREIDDRLARGERPKGFVYDGLKEACPKERKVGEYMYRPHGKPQHVSMDTLATNGTHWRAEFREQGGVTPKR